ncbi:MAG TPA: hypothetical protein P5346_15935, partial [Spirochaetota bacterium]|nr:hypothetical protein [Spirochaetota bacterium]
TRTSTAHTIRKHANMSSFLFLMFLTLHFRKLCHSSACLRPHVGPGSGSEDDNLPVLRQSSPVPLQNGGAGIEITF